MRALGLCLVVAALAGCTKPAVTPVPAEPAEQRGAVQVAAPAESDELDPEPVPESAGSEQVFPDGLRVETLRPGQGPPAASGDRVSVHYVGRLIDDTVFDSSRERGEPFEFKLGAGMVIKGFERGIEGMKVGELRRVTIPPELGYGERGMAKIPANSVLSFEIELVGVKSN